MSIDVSVVVATFNTGSKLVQLLDSLDRQTMPSNRFEVVMVDDGSTDDTWERLGEAAEQREYLRIERIPNSGWPGRPRNVGADLARGRYIFFADHDDELFPEALERMVALADHAPADVVVGKEVRAGAPTIGMEAFSADRDRADLFDDHVLAIITPHKLFRASFLRAHGIRFPEGRRRLEDHVFLALAYTRTDRIAVLSSYPCYRWIIYPDGSNNSDTLGDLDVYFRSLADVFDALEQAPVDDHERDRLLQFWYATRMLKRLGPYWFDQWTAEYRDEAIQTIADLAAARIPASLDHGLEPVLARRAALLRAGDAEGLIALADSDRGVNLRVDHVETEWIDGTLRVTVSGTLADEAGTPIALVADGEGLFLSDDTARSYDLAPFLPDADVELYVRHATEGTEWPQLDRLAVRPVERDGGTQLAVSGSYSLDPSTAALGAPLTAGRWSVLLRTRAFGYSNRQRLRTESPGPAIIDGLPVRPVNDDEGRLSLAVGPTRRFLDEIAGSVTVAGRGHRVSVAVAIPHLHLRSPDAVSVKVMVGSHEEPVRLEEHRDHGLSVAATVASPPGRHPVRLSVEGATSSPLATAFVGRSWQRVRTSPRQLAQVLRRSPR